MIKKFLLFSFMFIFLNLPITLKGQIEEDLFSEHIENVEILPSEIVKHLPMDINAQIAYFIRYFSTEKREVLQRWFKRCEPFLPYFRVIFREEGLPEDLIYLALVESGCNPFAVSPAKAVGIWQFIESTGRNYGLKIDFWIDERRDFIKSTYAAAKYLKKLYEIFGDWRLAVASYNAGEGRVSRALKAKNFIDYWQVMRSGAIPFETFAYLPQWLAVSAIAKNPQKYGFEPIREEPYDFIEVEVPGGLDLRALAISAETDWDTMRKLNAELRRDFTPPNRNYLLRIPYKAKKNFYFNLAHLELKELKVNTPDGEVILYTLEEEKIFALAAKEKNNRSEPEEKSKLVKRNTSINSSKAGKVKDTKNKKIKRKESRKSKLKRIKKP
ncbi:MAG: lytic transglycosylase domain-containing protein [Caldimicrobium sp.]